MTNGGKYSEIKSLRNGCVKEKTLGSVPLDEHDPDISFVQIKDIPLKRDANNPTTAPSKKKNTVK